jgi:S-DNA-T family DNA segregation ATPase FtsK/SpoIIIE
MAKSSKNRKVTRNASKPARRSSGRQRSAPRGGGRSGGRSREIVGIVGLGSSIFLLASLLSLQAGGGTLMGPFGRSIASAVYGLTGMCAYLVAVGIIVVSIRLLMDRESAVAWNEGVGIGIGLFCLTTLMHLVGGEYRVDGHASGGVIGEHFAEVLRAVISTAGTAVLAATGLFIAVVIATPMRMRTVLGVMGRGLLFCWDHIAHVGRAFGRFWGEVVNAILPERDYDEYLDDDEYEDDEDFDAYDLDTEDDLEAIDPPIIETETTSRSVALPAPEEAAPAAIITGDTAKGVAVDTEVEAKPKKKKKKATKKKSKKKKAEVVEEPVLAEPEGDPPLVVAAAEAAAEAVAAKSADPAPSAEPAAQPVIVESRFSHADAEEMKKKEEQVDAERLDFIPLGDGTYQLPPVNLLDYDESKAATIDKTAMLELSARLVQTLSHYGVKGEVVAIRPGPVVTMYEFAPAPGTRINKIVNLSDDLAMSLEALRVRIVAPIPGKAAVGIEVPNKTRETVYFKEIVADEVFQNAKHKLPIALGKDIEGAPAVVDLAKMPHLLVAGTTGSGKSVSVNSMITSLLYNSTPEDVRLIMVDPKMLELSIYEGVPHLLLPVVTDPKKANIALRWAVEEMERRYDLLAGMGVRDIASFNKKQQKLEKKYEADKLRAAAEEAERIAEFGDEEVEITEERQMNFGNLEEPPRHLPYIVVIIDEFADLMMCAPKEVETSVARIAQKARAAGIHLILATQRPSVDVITGLIKANFPSRAAFHVTSKVDSRTILDQGGAEALLGAGDMLFSDRGSAPRRLHGCFVDEEEIHRVVEFLKTQGRPVYNLDILKPKEEGEGPDGEPTKHPVDEMYDRAVSIVAESGSCSISMIQRRLRVGYNRAARMVEAMQEQGVVGPPDHTNRREVLISAA